MSSYLHVLQQTSKHVSFLRNLDDFSIFGRIYVKILLNMKYRYHGIAAANPNGVVLALLQGVVTPICTEVTAKTGVKIF